MGQPSDFQSSVQPYVVAALLCDQTIIEAGTNRKTLVNIYDTVVAEKFPFTQTFSLYVKITDAQGLYRLRIDLVSITANRILESTDAGAFTIDDRLRSMDLLLSITVPVPTEGSYEFRVFANDAFLTSIPFSASR